jgi:hypothetical protein
MTARETVVNKPLTGREVKQILMADFERMLKEDGILSDHMAFGRIGWEIILRKHLDNVYHPEDIIRTRTIPNKDEPALDTPPLQNPSPDAVIDSATLTRNVDSPNAERIRNGLPLDAEVRQLDGTRTIEQVIYPAIEELGEGDVTLTDSTEQARTDWSELDKPV